MALAEHLVELAYRAALGRSGWAEFVAAVPRTFDAERASLWDVAPGKGCSVNISAGWSRSQVAAYRASLWRKDPRLRDAASIGTTIAGDDEWQDAYRDVGFPQELWGKFRLGDDALVCFSITKRGSYRPFDDTDLADFERLVGHVQSALEIRWDVKRRTIAVPSLHSLLLGPLVPSPPERASRLVAQYDLTRRQGEVLAEIASGDPLGDVAERLGLTVNALRFHLKRIYARTGCQSHAQLVALVAGTR